MSSFAPLPLSREWILAQKKTRTAIPPLLDFVAQTSPHLEAPVWLAPIAEALERALREPTRLVFSTPPQHGKSLLIFHWLAWALLQGRNREILYLTYSDDFAASQMRRARPIALEAGVQFEQDSRALKEWNLSNGGKLSATGAGGPVTGKPAKLIVMDDLIKDWASAQSKTIREATDDWLRSAVLTRMHPDSSAVLVMTRWHEDDQAGRLASRGWEVINLPAISDDGVALWPEERPIEWLEQQREQLGDHIFSALYQGRPRARGGEVFQPPTWCELADIPTRHVRAGVGVDLAYTAKTSADRSVSLLMKEHRGLWYVCDVISKQVAAPDFIPVLRSHANAAGAGSKLLWHCAGTEKGSAQFIQKAGVPLVTKNAGADKFVRAQEVAAAWNAGKVLVPRDAAWAPKFVDEVCSFTGVGDARDDQVDALASAFDLLQSKTTGQVETLKRGRTKRLREVY